MMRARIVINSILLASVLSALAGAQVVLTDDANTSSSYPTKNFGSSIALIVGSGSNTYMKFSLAGLGSGITGSNVSKATLILYTDFVLTSGAMDVYELSGSWSEGSITYNSAPALGTKLFSAVSVTSTGYLSFDLTPTVQAWLNGTLANNGIALVPTSGSKISVSFDSKENILTSHTAQLPLVLVSAGPQGPQGPQGATGGTGPIGATGPAGPQGPQGLPGLIGLQGATGALGPQGAAGANAIGFNFRNAFDNSASYAVNDVATFQGASYVATTANQGPNNPTPDQNPAAWNLMAQAGAAGGQGSQGPAGPQGSPGPAGATGPSGAAGPAGSTGAAGPAGPIGPAGPAGPQGPEGSTGPAGGVSLIQQRAALLQWYRQDFAVGSSPVAIAFDGANVWVTNSGDNNVTKLRASDGGNLGTFAVGSFPFGIAFDGVNLWVTNFVGDNVTKVRASDGASLGTFPVGIQPQGIAFDGANLWVTNAHDNNVTKLRASDGANLGTFAVGGAPGGIAFDGTNLWVANVAGDSVTKLRASDGVNLGTFAAGPAPLDIAFDGTNLWVANITGVASKLRASDGANLGSFAVGRLPQGIAFDGANIWVANDTDGTVSKLPD